MYTKHLQKAVDSIEKQILYVVATPIGNLADITLRALAVLQKADIICAEDTRVTAQLLSAYGIQGKLVSVREHNEQQMADKIIAYLSDGLSVAQVSDAGTPAVCDPGAKLAARVREAGFKVVPVVGASAVMGALSVAGVTESDFYFNGFLPPKAGERQKLLAKWVEADFPIVMFETPHRIEASLADMAAQFPERRLTLAREITKTFETFLSGTVAEIQAALKKRQQPNAWRDGAGVAPCGERETQRFARGGAKHDENPCGRVADQTGRRACRQDYRRKQKSLVRFSVGVETDFRRRLRSCRLIFLNLWCEQCDDFLQAKGWVLFVIRLPVLQALYR